MVGNEFAGPQSKFPWRSIQAAQGWSIIFLQARGCEESILQPPSHLKSRGCGDLAAMGTPGLVEVPSIPTAVPGQSSPPGRAEHPSPAWQGVTPGRKFHCQRFLEVLRRTRGAGRAGSAGVLAVLAVLEPLCHAAPGPRASASSESIFSPAQPEFVGSWLLGSKQGLVTRLDKQLGRPGRGAAARHSGAGTATQPHPLPPCHHQGALLGMGSGPSLPRAAGEQPGDADGDSDNSCATPLLPV